MSDAAAGREGEVSSVQSNREGLDWTEAGYILPPPARVLVSPRLLRKAQKRKETDGDGRERDGWIVLDYNGDYIFRILE
jgi:hypothetical protein